MKYTQKGIYLFHVLLNVRVSIFINLTKIFYSAYKTEYDSYYQGKDTNRIAECIVGCRPMSMTLTDIGRWTLPTCVVSRPKTYLISEYQLIRTKESRINMDIKLQSYLKLLEFFSLFSERWKEVSSIFWLQIDILLFVFLFYHTPMVINWQVYCPYPPMRWSL